MRNTKLTTYLLGSALLLGSSFSYAETDFARIQKDVAVMSNIIKGAFEAEEACRGCKPRIEANYLANQGAVFTVRMNSWRSFKYDDDFSDSYSFVIPSPADVEHVRITEVVSEVLDNVGAVMEDVGERIELRLGDFEHEELILHQDSETRRALRDLNRERRELEYQRREHEIEMIHADEKERKKIESRIEQLEGKVNSVEEKQAKLSKQFETEREEREKKRLIKIKKAQLQAEEQRTAVENVVLRSLCDYGTTLKNIPKGEHVSLLFEQPNSDKTRIIVMEMQDVQGCNQANVLRSDSLSYEF